MTEGWLGDDYLVLFSGPEISDATERYAMETMLPGFEVLGLRSWDDFIVREKNGDTYRVPTFPVTSKGLTEFPIPDDLTAIRPDETFSAKIKWYVKPIALGGDPAAGPNLVWVSHQQHAELVRWWNARYRSQTHG